MLGFCNWCHVYVTFKLLTHFVCNFNQFKSLIKRSVRVEQHVLYPVHSKNTVLSQVKKSTDSPLWEPEKQVKDLFNFLLAQVAKINNLTFGLFKDFPMHWHADKNQLKRKISSSRLWASASDERICSQWVSTSIILFCDLFGKVQLPTWSSLFYSS